MVSEWFPLPTATLLLLSLFLRGLRTLGEGGRIFVYISITVVPPVAYSITLANTRYKHQVAVPCTICCTVRIALYLALVSRFSGKIPLSKKNTRFHLGLPASIAIHGGYIVNFNPHEACIRNFARKLLSYHQSVSRIPPNFGFLGNGPSRFISAVNSRSRLPRTSHHRLFRIPMIHQDSRFEWRSGVASANVEVEEIQRKPPSPRMGPAERPTDPGRRN